MLQNVTEDVEGSDTVLSSVRSPAVGHSGEGMAGLVKESAIIQ